MKKVAIIGGGIFGVSIALELNVKYDVSIFERSENILTGATTCNHLRHHYGYHYPRSIMTATESINARESFEKEYGGCVIGNFPAYYGISKTGSLTTPEDFLEFCNLLNLPYEIAWPDSEFMDRSKVSLCIKVPEPVYDPGKLRVITLEKLKNSNLKLNHDVIDGDIITGGLKRLKIKTTTDIYEDEFDYVIGAIYSRYNMINKWFNFPRKKILYELVELLEIELPIDKRIGLTLMDGEFSSVLPRGEKGTFTLGHVKESILREMNSDDIDIDLLVSENTISNKEGIINKGIEDFPIIDKANFVRSIFVARVVKPDMDDTDERPTEIIEHGNGIYSVFAGKIITCVEAAKKIFYLLPRK